MLFNIKPRITNPKGMATNNIGCIKLSFSGSVSLWILEEGGVRTGNTFVAEPERKSMPPLVMSTGLLPLARHYKFKTLSTRAMSLPLLKRDYCLIVDNVEKN